MDIRDEAYMGKPISALVVDAHTHLGPYYQNGWYQVPSETTTAAVISSMDHLGIDCIVTAPHFLIAGMMKTANSAAEAAIAEYPGRIYGYISVCPGEGMDTVKEQITKYGKHPGFVGFKFLPGYHGSLNQPEYKYAAAFANETGAVVLTHTWGNNPPLSEVESLSADYPRMKLLCAHQGGGEAGLSRKLSKIMERCPNLYMETCGSLINSLAMEDFVDMVGEDRVIYGSDMINLDPRYDFGRVVFSPLQDKVKKKLLSGNYLSLLKGSQMGQIKT